MPAGYEIVDVHVHLCRDTAQEKTVFPRPGWPDDWYWASPGRAERYMDFHGISQLVSVNIMDHHRMAAARMARLPASLDEAASEAAARDIRAEMRERVRAFNRWMCDVGSTHPRLIPFMMADPVLFEEELSEEIEECITLGARGLKVHPGICQHRPDHPSMLLVYDRCQELGLPILTDTGGEEHNGIPPFGEPVAWVPVLERFPRLRLIMAHFPGEYWEQRLDVARRFPGENLVFDTAGGFVDAHHPARGHREMPASHAARLFREVGVDRILFGSDAPSIDPIDTARQIVALDLTDDEKEKILSRNAKDWLGLGTRRPVSSGAASVPA